MDKKNFQFIQGSVQENQGASIRFFDSVDAWSVSSFTEEFNWLEKYVKPSKIKILINSEGGSVLRGMSAFSTIINSTIPTECIVEGLAASMGSVLLAAGNVSKMRDYGIIMIHNPFYNQMPDDPMVIAFKNQLKIIYKQRWGFSDEKIMGIMDGPDGEDGTYMDADAAVEYGIMLKENVITTESQKRAEINAAIGKVETKGGYAEVFATIDVDNKSETNNQIVSKNSTFNKEVEDTQNLITNKTTSKQMENKFADIAASLSMSKESTDSEVIARVVDLNKVEARISGLETERDNLTIANQGLQSSVDNVQATLDAANVSLTEVQAELNVFKQKELDKVKAEQEAMIDAAIEAKKIKAEAKDQWLQMAEKNPETVKATIDSMIGKAVISKEITKEASKEDGVEAQLTEAEKAEKLQADKVKSVIGEFEYKTL